MQSLTNERKRNQRKSPLTPKKSFRKEDSPPAIAMRVGGRVKKARIPFDPSDAVTKRRQTDSYLQMKRVPAGKDIPVVHYSCINCKKFDKPEGLVSCKGNCSTKIHLNCLQSICENFGNHEEDTWECNNCQSCTMCNKGMLNGKPLIKCYVCFSNYHPKCHGAEDEIKIVRENRFCCGICDKPAKRMSTPNRTTEKSRAFSQRRVKPTTGADTNKSSGDGKSGFLGFNSDEVIKSSSSEDEESHDMPIQINNVQRVVQRPAQQNRMAQHPTMGNDDVSSIDASDWSADQVYKYFKNIFPRHAHVFKDHEIDGPSLYLLKRGDIVKGFDMKIGPALKIYGHILKLQTKNSDPALAWH